MLDAVFPPDPEEVARIVSQALAEDRAFHDVTTRALVPDDQEGQGTFLYKSGGVVCGMGVVEAAFAFVSDEIELDVLAPDGSVLEAGQIAARLERVFQELGADRTAKHRPDLENLVLAYGKNVSVVTKKPTDDVGEVIGAIESLCGSDGTEAFTGQPG